MNKFLLTALATVAMSFGITSCNSDSDDNSEVLYRYDFTFDAETYNKDGYWVDVYDTERGFFGMNPYTIFTHSASVTEWDGVKYYSYKGFCPSRVEDSGNYPDSWVEHQWGAIAPSHGAGYLIACWDTMESDNTPVNERSCGIGFGVDVRPVTFTITNTAYGFYGMKDGTGFSKPFGAADWCKLLIHGVDSNGKETGVISVDLAANGTILDTWKAVDVTGLGVVNTVYFTMQSSDSGQWGMNNPAYFALGGMQVLYSSEYL